MSDDLFGGQLAIADAFSNTFSKFMSGISSATSGFSNFTTKIGQAERANRVSMINMERDIQELAKEYEKQGYTMSQALKKATSEMDRKDYIKVDSWTSAFGKIKQVGVDSFDSLNSKIQSFSNSTLGTITKLTAGFASFEGIKKGLETGFETGSEYQNLRLVLDNLYGSSQKGSNQFTMATNFASNSIWQEKDVVRSLSMLKGSGLDDSKNSLTEMSDLGSYEKAMGVGDINTATRAYMEMMSGRWNMMTMELGIKREDVEKFAKKNNMQGFDTKNGEITNKSALEKAFKGFIDNRGLTGLSDKMKDTATGRLSTLKDNINKSLADLIGVGNDGAVKTGSMFDKFCNGISKFTTKIQEFSESDKFQKLGDELSKLGDSIFTGFSYLLDHPEIITDILEFGVAIWSLGKISSVISSVTTIAGLFGEGGIFATITPILLPLAPILLGVAAGFFALKAILGDGWINEAIEGWKMLFKLIGDKLKEWFHIDDAKGDDTTATNSLNSDKWYGGKDGHTLMNDSTQYPTISGALASGQLTKNETNNNNNNSSTANKTNVNINIAKVEKAVDVDEIGDAIVKQMDKYAQTRNNLT